jgi:hypothetical protein
MKAGENDYTILVFPTVVPSQTLDQCINTLQVPVSNIDHLFLFAPVGNERRVLMRSGSRSRWNEKFGG